MGVGEAELGGELEPVLHAQVLLALEALLERLQLVVGERGARLARLLAHAGRRLGVVVAALARRAAAVVVVARRAVVAALLAVLVLSCFVTRFF